MLKQTHLERKIGNAVVAIAMMMMSSITLVSCNNNAEIKITDTALQVETVAPDMN